MQHILALFEIDLLLRNLIYIDIKTYNENHKACNKIENTMKYTIKATTYSKSRTFIGYLKTFQGSHSEPVACIVIVRQE